jgi:hypothetical protein
MVRACWLALSRQGPRRPSVDGRQLGIGHAWITPVQGLYGVVHGVCGASLLGEGVGVFLLLLTLRFLVLDVVLVWRVCRMQRSRHQDGEMSQWPQRLCGQHCRGHG